MIESAEALLAKLVAQGGGIVSSNDCSEMEIADARTRGDFYVDANGYGYVLRLKKWFDIQYQREAQTQPATPSTDRRMTRAR